MIYNYIKIMLALSIFLVWAHPTLCMDPLLYRSDLLIFLDWTQENIAQALDGSVLGPITNDFIEALYHESAPILCSSTLWLNIVQQAQFSLDLLFYNANYLFNKYSQFAADYGVLGRLLSKPYLLQMLIELRILASQIYLQVNRDIKELENKNFNEYEVLDYVISNENKYLSQEQINNINKYDTYFALWRRAKSLLVAELIFERVKSKKWEIRKVSDYLYLFVPSSYINNKKARINRAQITIPPMTGFSQEELILGLKVSSLPLVKNPFSSKELYLEIFKFVDLRKITVDPGESIIEELSKRISKDFSDNFGKIFISKGEIPDTIQENVWNPGNITWNIFGDGHGSAAVPGKKEFMVMSLTDDAFAQFLDFLNTKINTNFFFYTTCFAAGHRLRTQYDRFVEPYPKIILTPEMEEKEVIVIPKPLTFPIAVGAITHAATCSTSPELFIPPLSVEIKKTIEEIEKTTDPAQVEEQKKIIVGQKHTLFASAINLDQGKIEPVFATDYGRFFYLLNQSKNPYAAILDLAVNIYEKLSGTQALMASNIPHIRFPGSTWFSVVDLEKKATRLTITRVNVHEAENKPIIVRDKKAMLLYAHKELDIPVGPAHSEIRVPIIISGDRMPAVISLVAGDAKHYLEEVDARHALISDVFGKFAGIGISSMAYDRIFFIKKLICKNVLNSVAKSKLNADDQPILEFNDVVIAQHKTTVHTFNINSVEIKSRANPVNIRFTYKEKRFALDATLQGVDKPEGSEKGLKEVLQAFWAKPDFPKILGYAIPFFGEIKRTLDKFLQETPEKPKPYPYPLKKELSLRTVVEAEKARAQFPELIDHYETLKDDPDKVETWLTTLSIGQRAAMENYIEYLTFAAQEMMSALQRSLALLSINLSVLNQQLTG